MPDFIDEFEQLMQRVQDGSEEAAWELVERYGDAIRRAVRRALNARLRSKFDSLDFVQLVWCSFFRRSEQAVQFKQPEELVAFLAKMATNKVGLEIRRRLLSQDYNINRESSLDARHDEPTGMIDPHPAADEMAIAREQWERMLEGQPPMYRQIIQLRLHGMNNLQIAEHLHIARSTVTRFLQQLADNKLR